MRVHVTRKHIREGTPLASCRCPISRAIRDAIAREYPFATCNVSLVQTSPRIKFSILDLAVLGKDKVTRTLVLRDWLEAHHAYRFMLDFDHGLPVLPFSFDVDFV